MQIWKDVGFAIEDKISEVRALFDSGSSFTVMGHRTLERLFGKIPVKSLIKPREVILVNGQKITIDSFVDSRITINEYMIEERVYLSNDIVKKAMVEGREISLPDIIIGYLTMEAWGIELDIKRGEVVIRGGAFLL